MAVERAPMSNATSTAAASSFEDSGDVEEEENKLLEEPGEFFDPAIDVRDEEWAIRQRQGRKTDAVLSCPACFTTVCIDCQRHEKYVTQYRAMFVRNCTVAHDEIHQSSANKPRERSTKRKRNPVAQQQTEEIVKPVRCSVCNVQVGVLDAEEVYHFFDAIPSYP